MLNVPLHELPIVAFTRSDRVLDICLRELSTSNSVSAKDRLKNYKQAVEDTIFDMRAHQFRRDDIAKAVGRYSQVASCDRYDLDCLQAVAENYLMFEGDHFAVKGNLATKYQALISHIHPGFLIAGYFVKLFKARQLDINTFPSLFKKQCPLGFANNDQGQTYADNHVHFGGVNGAEVLTRFLFDRIDRVQLKTLKLPRVPEFAFINSEHYSVGTLVSVYRLLFDEFCRSCFNLPAKNRLSHQLKVVLKQLPLAGSCRLHTIARLFKGGVTTPQQKALLEMDSLVQKGESHQAMIAFAAALLLQLSEKEQTPQMHTLTLALVHLVNILRAYVVMSGVGLTHFVDFFASDIRRFNK
ncbi:MAG: hypothetical protein MJK04_16470, partial [Psychrosphaera sp.]|nr:hypothetical protein [Psychrosphaera sp.]